MFRTVFYEEVNAFYIQGYTQCVLVTSDLYSNELGNYFIPNTVHYIIPTMFKPREIHKFKTR